MEKLGGSPEAVRKPAEPPPRAGENRARRRRYSQEAVQQGRSEGDFIDHTRGTMNKWVEIVNGVSYILFLEYGYSQQAPHGMVRLSMRELRRGQLPQQMANQMRADWNRFYGY